MRIEARRAKRGVLYQSSTQSGVSLILVLLSLCILSLLASALISSTQSELWTTASYRKAAQARYVAEAGAQQAVNWLTNNFASNASLAGLTSTSSFKLSVSPAQYVGTSCTSAPCIIRMTSTGQTMSGGLTDTVSKFDATSAQLEHGFMSALNANASSFQSIDGSFAVALQLISAYNNGGGWVQKWKITSQGTVGVIQPAVVQVVEVVENVPTTTSSVPTPISGFNYGAFATSATCGAITINGGSGVASYNSATQTGVSSPTWTYAGGNIATLGNLALSGGAYVYGNIYAPGYNLGNTSAAVYYPYGVSGGGSWPYNNGSEACTSSKMYAANEDNSGSAVQCSTSTTNCANKASQLPTSYTASTYTSALTMVGNQQVTVTANATACNYSVICQGESGYYSSSAGQYISTVTLPPSTTSNVVNYGEASFAGSTTTYLSAGSYFFDTLKMTGSASMNIQSSPVVIYIQNDSGSSTPLNFTGGSFTNAGSNPDNLTFVYNGTQEIHIGNISSNTLFATIYAPNAKIIFDGNGSIYGAVIGKTVSITGGGHIIYDTNLSGNQTSVYLPQNGNGITAFHLTNFSWSVF